MSSNFDTRIKQIKDDVMSMTNFSLVCFEESLNALKLKNADGFKQTKENKVRNLNYVSSSIDNNVVVALALHAPEAGDLRYLIATLKITNELTRIGEAAQKYAKGMEQILSQNIDIEPLMPFIVKLNEITIASLSKVVSCFECFNLDDYRSVQVEEEKSDEVFALLQKELSKMIQSGDNSVEFLKIMRTMKRHERVTDHCQNIANLLYYVQNGGKLSTVK